MFTLIRDARHDLALLRQQLADCRTLSYQDQVKEVQRIAKRCHAIGNRLSAVESVPTAFTLPLGQDFDTRRDV